MVASADFDPRAAHYSLNLQITPDGVRVPGGDWLLTADLARSGQDLVLHGLDGASALVPNYFAAESPAPLITDSGARLEGSLVEVLAGPRAPMQFAEAQLAQASDASGAIGEVLDVQGTVHVTRADGSQADLAQGDAVFLKDVIQAAADGKVSIGFVDGTHFALSDGARMTLDDLVFNPGGSNNIFSTSVLQGTFVFLTGQIAPSGGMNVTTPVGTIGVRGTKVVCKLAVEGQESIITLLIDPNGHVGRVEITNAGGTRLLDQANQATRVLSFFIAPSEPVILSQPELLNLFNDVINLIDQQNRNPDNGNGNGDTGSNEKPGGGTANGEGVTEAEAQAAANFQTAAGGPVALPTTFVFMGPEATVPEAFVIPTFLTINASGVIEPPSTFLADSGSTADTGVEHTNDLQQPTAPPPPPPPEPFTVISGGTGNDTLGGGPTRLQVFGNGGDDSLSGGDLDDILEGGDGNDTLDAGPGDDVVRGGAGNDLIIGGSGAGNDFLDGGADIDTVKYQSATQDIDVNLTTGKASGDPLIGVDTLANIENVIGGSGNDAITGNGVANVLDGGPGNDTVAGLAGDDTLIGGSGDDTLAGGAGNDLLQGGAGGADVAVFSGNRSDYTVAVSGGQFIVTDERPGGDGVDTLDDIESVKFADQQVGADQLANQPPAAILLSNLTVAENALGAAVGLVTVTDPDAGDSHSFTISDARFQIVGGQLQLAPGKSLDFETEPSVSIDITTKDSGGLTHTQTFAISVTDVNEPPSVPADANNVAPNQVVENAANGTVVGITAQSGDPDFGDAVTYSLTNDAGGRFAIDSGTGVVTVADGSLLDFETATSHQITVQASSSGGLSATQTFTIDVIDASPPPSVPADSNDAPNQVAENAATGTTVGLQALSLDPDSADPVTYSLADNAGGRFAIDANTGVVTVADGSLLDFEAAASHQITIQATTGGGANASQTFTINVTNVNEPPSTPVDADLTLNQVAEQAATGTVVGITASSTDPDLGDTATYSLIDDAGGRFAIDSGTGVVTVANGSLLNADVAASHTIAVLASSSGGLSATQTFTINVTNVNHPPSTPADTDLALNQVAENAATGTVVGLTAFASEPDAGDTVIYSLTDNAGGRFAIDSGTGVVTVANGSLLDFETDASHTITVQASSSGGLSATQTFTVDLLNVNEPPSTPADSNVAPNQVAENAANGTVVGITALSADPDSGDAVTYSLADDAGGGFAIDSGTGVVTVADGSLLDFETATSHTITVQASSSGGLSATQTFTIDVINANPPPSVPVDSNDAPNQVAENAAAGTAVGLEAFAVDSDSADPVTYSLTDDAGGRFAIDANTGIVTVANGSLLDFESAASHQITVQATTGSGASASQNFKIDVANVNEPPSAPLDTDLTLNQVVEQAATGTVVGITASSTDPDLGDTVTYSLTDDAGGRFAIDSGTGVVTVADGSLLNVDLATSHTITVLASSSGGLSATETFMINVTDVNRPPSVPVDTNDALNQVQENAAAGTVVGLTAFASDPDAGDTVVYSLVDDAGGRFAIDSRTGVVTVANGGPLDFETGASHTIAVQASSSGGLSAIQTFTIDLVNVNEPPGTPADSNAAPNQVVENAVNGTVVGITALAIDPDGDTVTYSLTDDAGGRFAIDANTGIVTVANGTLLDFETSPSHTITVQASSGGGLLSAQTFTIAVTDVNESPSVPVDNDGSPNQVAENAAAGTEVGIKAFSTDPDAGGTVVYSLTGSAGGRFTIDASTGVVTVGSGPVLDFETGASHTITVQASSSGGLSSTQSFTIAVTNVNEPPSFPTDADDSANQVAENAAAGTVVGVTARSIDPDIADPVTYSLVSDAGGRFTIDATTGIVTVADGAALDFESAQSHQISVKATSSAGLFTIDNFVIAVTDVNEAPTITSNGGGATASISVPENTTAVATVVASDPDAGDAVTYSIAGGFDGNLFAIDATTGQLTFKSPQDFENPDPNGGVPDLAFDVLVHATDSGGKFDEQLITVTLTDANEPPAAPVDIDDSPSSVGENVENGTLVGITAKAIDPDSGDTVVYSLTDSAGGRFAIDSGTGVVTVADGSLLDFESAASHDVTVKAASSGGLSSEQTFTINVGNGNELGPVTDNDPAANTVAENAPVGTAVGITGLAIDPDSGDSVSYSLTNNPGGLFAIDGTAGIVTVAGALTAGSHSIEITATDNHGLSTAQTFSIDVTGVADNPPSAPEDTDPGANSVAENAAAGTLVGITASSVDPDPGDTVTYSLADSAGGRFAIDANTGVVTVANGALLDFETDASHTITVEASGSGGSSATQTFLISVTDVNEPPSFPTDADDSANQVAENAAAGTVVGVTARSIDPDISDPVTYSLVSDAGGRFTIDANTGIVTVADGAVLDFEAAQSHQISVKAASSGGLFAIDNFVIAVTDVNEAPLAPVDADDSPNSVGENVENGALVGITAKAVDPDAGDTVVYSLTDSAGGRFAIDSGTGVVTVADGSLLDFETAASHGITVKATSGGGLSSTQTSTINVTDVNEPASTPVDTDAGANQVTQNAADGTKVGITAFSTDPDAGDPVAYSLSNDAGGLFAIDPSSGIVTVANGALLADGSYEITVEATSNGGLSASQTFTINVSGANDAPVLVAGNLIAARGSPDLVHETELKATDDSAAANQIVYTLTTLPIIGTLLLNNVALGVGAMFTQQDIADGLLTYMSAGTLGDDSFVVDISDGTNVLSGQTITVTRFDSGAIVDGDVGTPNLDNPLIVGDTAYGRLNILGGADVSAGAVIVGNTAGGNGTVWVNGAGSTLAADGGSIEVGKAGFGLLLVTEGGLVTANQLVIGSEPGSGFNVTVNGGEVHLTGTGNGITVGEGGSGNLQVELGGKVTGLELIVGDQAASFGQVSIGGPGSQIVLSNDDGLFAAPDQEDAGRAVVGNHGIGILNISDGGHLEIRSGQSVNTNTTNPILLIGRYAGSVGEVTVSGAGSSLDLSMSAPADPNNTHELLRGPGIAVGLMGTGAMIVEEGAAVSLDGEEAFISVGVGNYLDPNDMTAYPTAVLDIQTGGKITLTDTAGSEGGLIIGDFQSGTGIVNVAGAGSAISVESQGGASVGREGDGTLNILDGGKLEVQSDSFNNLLIGAESTGSTGLVLVSGPGSAIVTTGTNNTVQVGYEGTGTLSVSDGGTVSTLFFAVGYHGHGTAVIEYGGKVIASNDGGVFAGASQHYAGRVSVSSYDGSSGSLLIQNGGALELRAGATVNTDKEHPGIVIGYHQGSEGLLTVTGSGSAITISMSADADPGNVSEGLQGPSINVGIMGHGEMLVGDHAVVALNGDEAFLSVGAGNVNDPGDPTKFIQSLMTISGGATVSVIDAKDGFGGLLLGDFQGGDGSLIVTGSGSLLAIQSQGGADVGRAGAGTLLVTGGATVTIASDSFNNLNVGYDSTSTGLVQVIGPGSKIVTTGTDNTVQIGRYGQGELDVTNGGVVSTLQFEVGRYGSGIATIAGPGSKVIASNDGGLFSAPYAYEAGFVRIGGFDGGNGTLTITDGGVLEIRPGETVNTDTNNAGIWVGGSAGSIGSITVSGPASKIVVEGYDNGIQVGRGGDGSLSVTDGAQVTTHFLQFGRLAGSTGTGLVSGPGSAVISEDKDATLLVGRYGTGELEISAGGSVTTEFANIGRYAGSMGSIVVTGAGSQLITAGTDNSISLGQGNEDKQMPGGSGTLTVEDGGLVKTLNLGIGRDGSGTVTIDGDGTAVIVSNDEGRNSGYYDYESGFVRVSRNAGSYGSLSVTNGAHLDIRSGIGVNEDTYGAGLAIGRDALSSGHVLVSGAGSRIAVTQEVVPPGPRYGYGPYVRVMGQGSLVVQQQGQVVIEGPYARMGVGDRDGANGHVEVTSGGSILIDNKDQSGGLSIAGGGNTIGSVVVSGIHEASNTHSSIVLAGVGNRLSVGTGGEGSLEISGGGIVKALAVDIGYAGSGSVKVDGVGSQLIVSNDEGIFQSSNADAAGSLSLSGDATLQVVRGGLVEVRAGTQKPDAVHPGLDIGFGSGSIGGTVLVSGQGSLIHISQTADSGGVFNGGGAALSLYGAKALVTVQDSGQIVVDGPGSIVGVGGATVDAADTPMLQIIRTGDPDTVGSGQGGSVLIDGKDGSAALFIAGGPNAPGTVVVSGIGSSLTVAGGTYAVVHVGYAGEGRLAVTSGGTLTSGISGDSVGSEIVFPNVDVQIFSHGVLDGGGGKIVGGLYMDQGSQLLAADQTISQLDIQGNLLINDATVSVDVRGNGQSDLYNVTGRVDIWSAQIELNFLGTYTPQAGDGFTFLRSATTINVDPNSLQYILHGISAGAGGVFGFNIASDGNFMTFTSMIDTAASDGLTYRGSSGDDVFTATTGHDEIYGGAGSDQLLGEAGSDFIVGGPGEDKLDGGGGLDSFFYQAPSDGTHTAVNTLASNVGTGDVVMNFDATIGTGDKLVFNAAAFNIAAISSLNFAASDAEYDGTAGSLTNGASSDYQDGKASFIMDGGNHLIYDDNGAADGYTVVATVEVAPGSPAVTHDNLQAA